MGFTGNPVGVSQDLQLHISLSQTAADTQKKQEVRDRLSYHTGSLSMHSMMNVKPNSKEDSQNPPVFTLRADMKTFLKSK